MSRPHPPLAPDPGARIASLPGRRARAIRIAVVGMAAVLALVAAYAWQQRQDRDPGPDAPAPGPPEAAVTLPGTDASPVAPGPTGAARPIPAAGDIVPDQEALDDAPPATLDSPQTRLAWLERIRELRDAGATAAARDSLAEYRRRYPGLEVPEDLQGLLTE